MTFVLSDSNFDPICEITISSSSNIAEATVFGSQTASSGFIMDASTANIVTDCDGLLNPADWTNNIANAIKNGGQSFGVGLTSALTSADPLYSEMETSLTQWGYDWTNDFEPYVFGAGVYMSPLTGFLEVDLNNDATIDTTYYTRNWNVDSSWQVTGTMVPKADVLTTKAGAQGGSIFIISFGTASLHNLIFKSG